ncbi:MAG: MATE family efflux transporter [Lachnospiraceae bacterium]|nr:MATE family efflux transporter [Lachnospiraceae bacterium]
MQTTKSEDVQYKKLTETPVLRLIITLSIPTIISMLVTNIYNLVDTAFVGTLGTSASGAVGVVFGFMAIIQAFGFLFGQGSGSIVSRLLGAKQINDASKTASTAFLLSFASGLIITLTGFIFLDHIVIMLGSTPPIAPYAKTYIRYILCAAPFMTSSFTLNNILRYEGRAFFGMIGLLTGGILNIAGDAVFIFGIGMGIGGAGLSTAISQIVSFCILLSMFVRGKTQTKLHPGYLTLQAALIGNIMATGLPSLLRQGLGSLSTIILNKACGVYGDSAVAAMSIVNRIIFFVFSVALGFGQGFQPVSGFNYGAGKYKRVRRAFWCTLVMGEIFIVIVSLIVAMNPDEIIALFRDDPDVVAVGHRALMLQCMALPTLPLCMITEMLFQSTGQRAGAAVLSSLRSGIFLIPALILLSYYRGLTGIQEAQAVAFVLSFVTSLFFLIWYLKRLPKE